MSGYTDKFLKQVDSADQTLLGVRLARQCIRHRIPIPVVADTMKVSKPTIYHWFSGKTKPMTSLVERIEKLIGTLEATEVEVEEVIHNGSSNVASGDAE